MNYFKQTFSRFMAGLFFVLLLLPCRMQASDLSLYTLDVQLQNTTLQELFELIEEQFNYSFLIRNNDINLKEEVTIDTADKSVEEILKSALKNQHADFVVNDNRIIVYKSTAKPTAEKSAVSQITQQNVKLSGQVVDAMTGEPIIGANVIVKGTTIGTGTDFDGNFSFEGPVGATLIVTYIGYNDIEVVATAAPMTIKLREDTQALEEVVVVGYSVQRKESLTGSLQAVSADKLKDVTSPTVENMLNGKAPGVYVTPGTGQPGDAGKIIIRGKSTVNGTTDPLWVIDGVIVGDSPGALNSADIETMTILKDAASTAIYGSQGANGVIVVTTKSARSNKMSINLSVKAGVTRLNNGNVNMMNGAELYDYFSSFPNQEEIKFARWNPDLRNSNFNWWDLATHTGVAQDYNLSISGGSDQLKSYLSVGYYDEAGAVKGYDYKRYTFRYKTDYKPFSWLTIKPNISGAKRDIHDAQYSTTAMYVNLPWDSAFDEDGSIMPHKTSKWVNSNKTNYLYDLQWNYAESTFYEFSGNFDFDIKITDWLTFASVNSYRWQGLESMSYADPRSDGAGGVNGRLTEKQTNMYRRYTNQLLRFNKTFGDHAVNGLIAYEFSDYRFKEVEAIGTGLVPGSTVLNVTSIPEAAKGYINEAAVQSYLFNANYSYKHKYLAQFSVRRDGASNFGANAKYGNFFSISGGWNINREDFFTAEWVDALKLRVAYGTVGSKPRDFYPQFDLYSVAKGSSYNGVSGATISQVGNKDLSWEKSTTLGIGVDFDLFERVRVTLDYYNKRTIDLLHPVPVSGLTGVTKVWQNVGELENNGFEVTIGADLIKTKDWLWTLDFNLGHNKNKVKELYGEEAEKIYNPGYNLSGIGEKILRVGLDADTWYLREWAGVDPENGAPLWYKTVTHDDGRETRETTKSYSEADLVPLKSSAPKVYGGFSTGLQWKHFDLNAVFGYSIGGTLYNYFRTEYDSDGAYTDRNQMNLIKGWSRWEKPGDIATHPLASYENKSNSQRASSRFMEKGDYLKMRSLTLGYNLSLPDWHIANLRIFFTGENLFTITPYSGFDPEVAPTKDGDGYSNVSGVAGPGVYPSTRKFMFGVNITL